MRALLTEDFTLGLEAVDAQHKRVLDCIRAIDEVIDQPGPDMLERLKSALTALMDCIEEHFAYEEALLEKAGYPMLEVHKKTHDLFRRRLNRYLRRCEAGEAVAKELLDTLEHWLNNHLRHDDADYVKYLQKPDQPPPAAEPREAESGGGGRWRLFGR